MTHNEEDILFIHKSINGGLSEDELRLLKERIEEDRDFFVELKKTLDSIASLKAAYDLRNALMKDGVEIIKRRHTRLKRFVIISAITCIIVIAVILLMKYI